MTRSESTGSNGTAARIRLCADAAIRGVDPGLARLGLETGRAAATRSGANPPPPALGA